MSCYALTQVHPTMVQSIPLVWCILFMSHCAMHPYLYLYREYTNSTIYWEFMPFVFGDNNPKITHFVTSTVAIYTLSKNNDAENLLVHFGNISSF